MDKEEPIFTRVSSILSEIESLQSHLCAFIFWRRHALTFSDDLKVEFYVPLDNLVKTLAESLKRLELIIEEENNNG